MLTRCRCVYRACWEQSQFLGVCCRGKVRDSYIDVCIMTHHRCVYRVSWEQWWFYVMLLGTFVYPLTEDIWLKCGSADYTFFPYNQGSPVYSRENLFKILGSPVKTFLKVTGSPVKTCWNFGSRNDFKSDLLRLWFHMSMHPPIEFVSRISHNTRICGSHRATHVCVYLVCHMCVYLVCHVCVYLVCRCTHLPT